MPPILECPRTVDGYSSFATGKAQGEGDLSNATAPGHLVTVLTQLLMDQLDHMDVQGLAKHGNWLSGAAANAPADGFKARMNGLLLTGAVSSATAPFFPGTVYRVKDATKFAAAFGHDLASLLTSCTKLRPTQQQKFSDWNRDARAVLVEISPACDVAQNKRINSLLIAGVVVPAAFEEHRQAAGEAFTRLPSLHLRWAAPDFSEQDAALIFCHRYRITMPFSPLPDWIEPWFRLREMPTVALGAAHASHAARIGYVLMTD